MKKIKIDLRIFIYIISIILLIVFLLLLANSLSKKDKSFYDIIFLTLLVSITPIGIYEYLRMRRIEKIEEELPNFLRDLANSTNAGMTLFDAIKKASLRHYGGLTRELKKMAEQIAWGIPVSEVLQMFSERVRTPLIERSVNLIIEASKSGGNISDVLMSAAIDAKEIKNLEKERIITMASFSSVIYLTFFVFLAIIFILSFFLVPKIVEVQNIQTTGIMTPLPKLNPLSLLTAYYILTLIQSLGSGIIIGILSTGKIPQGLKHSVIMILLTYIVFRGFLLVPYL